MHLLNDSRALHSPNNIRLYEKVSWTCEGGLALVVQMDPDLMITRVTIQVAEEGVVSQPL
jgi:hypothetical protein